MLRCQAVVTRVGAGTAEFRVVPEPACSSCQQGRGCGMGLFERKQSAQLIQPLDKLHTLSVQPMTAGQRVELAVSAEALLGLSWRAYLLPLVAALFCAAALAPWGDLAAVLGLILGLAMVINMFVAATAGTLIPLSLRALKIDPALASSVFITTLTDVFGFLSFLGLGTLFLRFLQRPG